MTYFNIAFIPTRVKIWKYKSSSFYCNNLHRFDLKYHKSLFELLRNKTAKMYFLAQSHIAVQRKKKDSIYLRIHYQKTIFDIPLMTNFQDKSTKSWLIYSGWIIVNQCLESKNIYRLWFIIANNDKIIVLFFFSFGSWN